MTDEKRIPEEDLNKVSGGADLSPAEGLRGYRNRPGGIVADDGGTAADGNVDGTEIQQDG